MRPHPFSMLQGRGRCLGWILAGCLTIAGCSHDRERAPHAVVCPAAPAAGTDRSALAEQSQEAWNEEQLRKEKFASGKQAFEAVRDALLTSYHDEGVTEDDLYRAAARGMLENADPAMRKWNRLLAPSCQERLRDSLKGQIVGIGVRMNVDPLSGRAEIASVVPATPADRAGLKPGDLVVSVDGKLCNGPGTREALDKFRGPVGQSVTLQVLRGDKLMPVVVQRDVIAIDDVAHQVFAGDIGYVAVHSFSARTRGRLQAAMEALAQRQPKGLVLDLRDNMGGGFEDAVGVAEQFVAAGEPMMIVQRRGGRKEVLQSKGAPRMLALPLVVLVNHDTSAAAEVLAASLQEKRRARVVGVPTLGKWNIQDVKDLPNGYAYKFTTAVLQTPSGKRYEGTGLIPDVQVDMTDEQMATAHDTQDPVARLALDPQLRTAVSMFDTHR